MMKSPLSPKRKVPAKYSDQVALKIIARIADGEPLSEICRSRGMPASRTFRRWCSEDKTLADAVAEAKRVGSGKLADDLIARAIELDKRGRAGKLATGEIAAFKEHSSTLRWFLARLDPARFGGAVNASPVHVTVVTSLKFDEEYEDPTGGYTIDVEPVE